MTKPISKLIPKPNSKAKASLIIRRNKLRHLPQAGGLPLVGNSLAYFKDPLTLTRKLYNRHGPVYVSHTMMFDVVALLGPEANELILKNQDELVSNEIAWEFFLHKFFHRGVMLMDGSEHRMHRRIMQEAFKREALQQYALAMQPSIIKQLEQWPSGQPIKVYDRLKALTLTIGTEVFLGEPASPDADRINEAFIACVRGGADLLRLPIPGTVWQRGIKGRKVLENYFYGLLPKKRQSSGHSLFERLCTAKDENGQQFSDDDVVNHIIFVLMAAHDTATITLTNMMYQLGKHTDWQDKLRAEALQLDDAQISESGIGQAQLQQLPMMLLAMKETLRLVPPLPVMPRLALKAFQFGGHDIPKGALLQLSPLFSHHMAQYWSNPEAFDPMRFGAERAEDKQHPFLFVPFGGGAHKCIGLHFGELEVCGSLLHILKRFRWTLPADYEMQQDWLSLPMPKDRLPMTLERLPTIGTSATTTEAPCQ